MSRTRSALLATTGLLCLATALPARAQRAAPPAAHRVGAPRRAATLAATGDTIQSITVQGNRRIETSTILSYMPVQAGEKFSPQSIDNSLRTLYASGLFSNVSITRQGNGLVVHVVENPIIDRIAFEGNSAVTDKDLTPLLSLRPRAVYTAQLAQQDRQAILNYYAAHGRYAASVTPEIIRLPDNRVNVVFRISEGRKTYISRIAFVGNHAYSADRLREVVSSRQEAFYRFFSNSDEYNPNRIDYDKELLRRFYLRNGFVDFSVLNATAELSPDRRSFFITFTVHEGSRYHVAQIAVNSTLRGVDGKSLLPLVQLGRGDIYDGDAVQRSVDAIEQQLQTHGHPFAQVNPEIARNTQKHTVNLVFNVEEGPRGYVERIDIQGNTRTQDRVIRRQFNVAEGDPFIASSVKDTRQKLQDLGYFKTVTITPTPGSTPNQVVLNTGVVEKATGSLTIGGGYSTDDGALASAGLSENNLVGTGIAASLNGTLAQRESQVDLSMTDPYFLNRNLVAGYDLYRIVNNNLTISNFEERREGVTLRLGYQFNDHLSQALNYSLVNRDVYNVNSSASIYVQDEAGTSLLSQVGQTFTIDYRDSPVNPHTGFVTRLGTDFAGIGGNAHFVRTKIDGSYYVPLDALTGDSAWGITLSAGAGYLFQLGRTENIVDRFFLGGDNLRGFQDGGAGPHSSPQYPDYATDSIGGRFIYTQSTQLNFPLPVSPDLGLSGHTFVDIGGLSVVNGLPGDPVASNTLSPRVGAGVGVSWQSPFGLITVDLAQAVVKQRYDQTQLFRFGFGTRF